VTGFVRYPHTPHLASLSATPPRGDKLLTAADARDLLSGEVTVEEKIDGANVGLSVSDGQLAVQNRGAILTRSSAPEQFRPLWTWLGHRAVQLIDAIGEHLIIFGEWCYARHSVAYTRLPDWFLVFDVYDRSTERLWAVDRREDLARNIDLVCVPRIARGRFKLSELAPMIGRSRVSDAQMEGIVVRRDEGDWQVGRAKLVHGAFVQNIEEHWSRRRLEPNHLERAPGR
jgi:ATP-dependent RNA circularization protein (DNA/RNA ligase family)